MTKKRKSITGYQVDSPRYGGVKKVSDLTEREAKEELCMAMDLIEKLMSHAMDMVEACRKENYLS